MPDKSAILAQLTAAARDYERSIVALETATSNDGVNRSASIAAEKASLARLQKQIETLSPAPSEPPKKK